MRRQFHNNTSVGVLTAGDISQGRALSESVGVDAVITDLYFDQGKDSPKEDLYDGVDLAAAIKKRKPDLPIYVLSFLADDPALHKKAEEKGLSVVRWLPKTFTGGQQDELVSPWRLVETDLLRNRYEHDPISKSQLAELSDPYTVLSLATRLRHPIRTYIQGLPDPALRVTKPMRMYNLILVVFNSRNRNCVKECRYLRRNATSQGQICRLNSTFLV